MDNNLLEKRQALADTEQYSYDPSDYPGSRRWKEHKKHADVLKAFDAAHPEIIEGLKAERDAARKAKFDNLSDFVKNGG